MAAIGSSAKRVKLLLDAGSDVSSRTRSGLTPLHSAVSTRHCNVHVVELLLKAESDVLAKDNGGRCLLDWIDLKDNLETRRLLESYHSAMEDKTY